MSAWGALPVIGEQTASPVAALIPAATTLNPLGINLNGLAYYSTEQPFINVMKQASNDSYSHTCWYTTTTGSNDTGEEPYLNLDSNGYPINMTGIGLGSQTFTGVYCQVFTNLGQSIPTVSSPYPAGTYRLQFTGTGTVKILGDGSLTLSNSTQGATVSNTFTLTPSTVGFKIYITSTDPSSTGDYVRNISVVQNSLASSYDGGAIFTPTFLVAMSKFSSFRFMDWMQTNPEAVSVITSGAAVSGTSMTLANAWSRPTQSKSVYWSNGDLRTVSFTAGSTNATWSTALSSSVPYTFSYIGQGYCSGKEGWGTKRATPGMASYAITDYGVPLEVCIALCNTIGADGWFNMPYALTDAEMTTFNNVIINGANGFAGLNTSQRAVIELSNEMWNYRSTRAQAIGYIGCNAAAAVAGSASGGSQNYAYGLSYRGQRVAQMSVLCQSAWGASFSRCYPIYGAQGGSGSAFDLTSGMQAQYWSGKPASNYSNYPIKCVAIAPYFADSGLTQADVLTMLGQSDGGLTYFFNTLTTNNMGSGVTLSSVPATGWFGQITGWMTTYNSQIATLNGSGANFKLISYEGGQGFNASDVGLTGANLISWATLILNANRDARMGSAYTTYLNLWATNVGSGRDNIHHLFNDVGAATSQTGAVLTGSAPWGALESIYQTLSPLSSAPPKWQAIHGYIGA